MAVRLNVLIERDAHGYFAYCPELPGCQSQGEGFDEVLASIREAAALYLETLPRRQQRSLAAKQIFATWMEVPLA